MALRESGRVIGKDFNLLGLVEPDIEIGVDGGTVLRNFADAVLGDDPDRLNRARMAVSEQLGPDAVAVSAIIAGCFSNSDRVANSLGLPTEAMTLEATEDFREALGINAYRSAAPSLKS